jgi:ankyrin repeat protein
MNNKRLISLTACLILATVPGISSLLLADIASETDTKAQQHCEKANELRKLADYDGAITEYKKVISLSSNSKIARDAQYWIGQSYFKAGQFDAALSAFEKLLDEYPASTIIPSTKVMMERVQQAKKVKSLHEAAEKGDIDRVKALIAAGADIHARNEGFYGRTPLIAAAREGHAAVAELLIDEGADVNARQITGHTSLQQAAWRGHLDVVELLISRGANIEAGDNWGSTPLGTAVSYNSPEAVKLLLKRGAYIEGRDHYDNTPLHRAITKGNQDMVELLLANGAAPWRRSIGLGLVGIAMKANLKEMVTFLIDKGIEHSAVHVAAFLGDLDQVKSYLAAGGDINARDRSWSTLLVCAIFGGQAAEAEFLISKGADINLKSAEGATALNWALARDRPEIARMLLDKGADITIRDDYKRTPLLLAAAVGYKDIVETLLARGADVNAKTGVGYRDGWTPLHMACRRGHKAVAGVLIAHGADINVRTKSGKTPMSVSREQIVELLQRGLAVELTSPATDNFAAVGEPVLLKANVVIVKDVTVHRVEFLIDGAPVGEVTNPPYQFNWDPARQGSYSAAAKVYDSEGGTERSLPVDVFVGIRGLRRFIAHGQDDAEEPVTGSMDLTGWGLHLGWHHQHVAIRFREIGIPKGTLIKKAYLQFTTGSTTEQTDLVIHAELAADAQPFSAIERNITSRRKTTTSVKWSPESWKKLQTPDLSSLIQEVLAQPDWQEGNALVLIINGSGHSRSAVSYDHPDAVRQHVPMLHIEY